jgi:N-acetylneuraminic acid mutarotase
MKNRLNLRFRQWLLVGSLLLLVGATPAQAQNGWSNATSMTSARQAMMTGVIDGKIYVAGGYGPSYLDTLEVYDPMMNTWTSLAPMPELRAQAAAGVIDGKLFIAGGYDGSTVVNTLFVYDPVTNAWSTAAPMPTARFLASAGVINGKLYVTGGTLTNTGSSTDKLEVYDPVSNSWATKAPMPPTLGRYGAVAAVLTNKLYVTGGYGDAVGYSKLLEVYDPLTDSWTARAPLPQIQHVGDAVALNGQIYVIGGEDATNFLNIVSIYEPTTDIWSIGPAMPTKRYLLSAAVVGNHIHAIGGSDGTQQLATHEVFTLPSCVQPPANLVGWWSGDGDARDHTGVNNGTPHLQIGHSGISVGHVGQTFSFQPGEYVSVPDNDSLEMSSQFTLAAWIRPDDVSTDRQIISRFGTSGHYAYQFGLSPNGGFRADYSADGTTYGAVIAPNDSLLAGVWQHVAATFNAGTVKLYVNGIEVASNTSSVTSIYSNGSAELAIGRDSAATGQYFFGAIDEAMVFNRALSPIEIGDIFTPGKNGVCKSGTTNAGANSQTVIGDETITFQNATTAGTTTTNTIAPLGAGDLPVGYTHTGLAYDITTSASFTGPLAICFHLPSLISASAQTNLRVLHFEGGTLVDRTTGREFSSSTLCSSVTSLSPFVIASSSAPTAAPTSLSGLITTSNGQPLAGAVVSLSGAASAFAVTNSQGYYRFTDLESGSVYIVTPSFANHTFSPAQRSFARVGNKDDAVFSASPDTAQTANALDSPEFFVRQHYLDFLGREPDESGLRFWVSEIRACPGDAQCANSRRTGVSAAFFIEQEFQRTGNFIYRLYKASLGRQPNYAEFESDRDKVVGGATLGEQQQRLVEEWVTRPAFRQQYLESMSAAEFVNRLFDTAELSAFEIRHEQIRALLRGDKTRVQIVRDLIDNPELQNREYNQSFVLMQYFGYLRRNPDRDGYNFWLNVLDHQPGNFRGMVCAFITSSEYQQRFSSVVTHTNAECQH